ncbi:adenylate/guanylate cyclase domain-containing protein [Maribacter sp. 2307UL18-2]|uniref:adenylate/guanylate cyclase domain-containing protein n=1 Tax=Maribacter sp. 2307UL18-2 TaxID=3386274 RepID=UPI0039BCD60E
MDPKKERLLLKIVPYPIIFLLGGLLYANVEYGLLGESYVYPVSEAVYDPLNSVLSLTIMTIILGLVLGIIEESVFKNRFKELPFVLKILSKTLLYISIFAITLLGFSLALNIVNTGKSLADAEVYQTVFIFFSSYGFISIILFASFFIGLSLFFTEIVDYLGLDIVGNFFSGTYSKPVYESRIFMFLDMKDSTTIAEKIGHKKHYQLINEYYSDMTEAIVQTEGSIYQYVGDEIVVSWKLDKGLRNWNCLKCFFLIENGIQRRSENYLKKYGVVPGFKAGLHCGEVTRGQIGQIKRDLLYTGDVLNSTARIQGLCNHLGVNLLISGQLKKLLPKNNLNFKPMGAYELRGRLKKKELFAVSENN